MEIKSESVLFDAGELAALLKVADVAAFCLIDLRSNLRDANKEYMDGAIPKGAFHYVLSRHDALCAALHAAGYTETNPLFDIPMRPRKERDEGERGNTEKDGVREED